ncbi:MAG: biopolymer transporter ExbD [candidate division WOR-3 bacterium]
MPKSKAPQEAEIPTASMADIAFLLIIFFMTSTVFMRDKGLKLVLPEKTDQIVKVGGERVIRVSINDVGDIFLEEEQVSSLELKEKLTKRIEDYKAKHEGKDPIIVIRTNVEAQYEKMIEVFDVVKQIPEAKAVSLASIKTGG